MSDATRTAVTSATLVGAAEPLAHRLVTALAPVVPGEVRVLAGAARTDDLDRDGALVLLGPARGADLDGLGGGELDLAAVRASLQAASAAGTRTVVALSSALVYGAWPDNPVPLTEDAVLRPDPGLPAATGRAELERAVAAWRDDHEGARVAVLRPAVTVAPERADWFRTSPWSGGPVQVGDADPPRQYLHVDDLVSALVLAVTGELEGTCNVAPDGWLPPDVARELAGPTPRLRVPDALAQRLARLGRAVGIDAVPPEVLAVTVHPWVVANDRLRAAGWEPQVTNEEAFVEVDRAGPLRSMSPRTRQELSLAAAAVAAAGLAATGVVLVRRGWRRR